MITADLLEAIFKDYRLHPLGTHGVSHWARVLENGRRLAERTGARRSVVELFAVFHDARRESEVFDPRHGKRGADLAAGLRGRLFDLPDADFDLLYEACAHHADGLTKADVTVQTCWDADRLDLLRAGIHPAARRLCTAAARDPQMIEWACRRSKQHIIPALVTAEWGLEVDDYG